MYSLLLSACHHALILTFLLRSVSLKEPISIQLATLYTTNGVRKVRIHTLSLAVSSRPSSILKAADVEAITVVIAKQAAQTGMKLGLAVRNGPREGIMHAMERILVGKPPCDICSA